MMADARWTSEMLTAAQRELLLWILGETNAPQTLVDSVAAARPIYRKDQFVLWKAVTEYMQDHKCANKQELACLMRLRRRIATNDMDDYNY